jgi:uncharacterized delta-60 repeat protein
MASDPVVYRITAAELNGTYTVAIPAAAPTIGALVPGNQQVEVTGWVDPTDLGSGTAVVARQYTSDGGVTWRSLLMAGRVDTAFNQGANVGTSSYISNFRKDPDGKILIGGFFVTARGVTQNGFARLNSDGSLDTGFNTGASPGIQNSSGVALVKYITQLSTGRIIIVGQWTSVRGVTKAESLAALTSTGTLDTSYTLDSSETRRILELPDGKTIYVGLGNTMIVGGVPVTGNGMWRFNANDTHDTSFNSGSNIGVSGNDVNDIVRQSDGKLIIGGPFVTARGVTQNGIARLNDNGSIDTGFNTAAQGTVGVAGTVRAIALQPDGKILICGTFTTARGVTQNNIARLNSDGSLDTGFNTGATVGANDTVRYLDVQLDGKILIGGEFSTVRGVARRGIARLNADGTLDTSFLGSIENSFFSGSVSDILVNGNSALVSGSFLKISGVEQNNIATILLDSSFIITETSG